jgi:transposase
LVIGRLLEHDVDGSLGSGEYRRSRLLVTDGPAPFAAAVARLDEIPGINLVSAYVILAEIGTDMTRFPTAGHLASWARLAPGINEPAGKKKGKGSTGHGNAYLASVLGNAAASAARTDTFLGEKYRRIARRRGSKRAIVALGRSILVITWHLLSDPGAHFHDLGAPGCLFMPIRRHVGGGRVGL